MVIVHGELVKELLMIFTCVLPMNFYSGHSHQMLLECLLLEGIRNEAYWVGKGYQHRFLAPVCLSLAGPAKPQTFLWSYTSLMTVQLTFELKVRPNRLKTKKNRTAIVTSVI